MTPRACSHATGQRRYLALAVVVLTTVACTKQSSSKPHLEEREPPAEQRPGEPPPATAWAEPARTHLLLQRHAALDDAAGYLPVQLSAEGELAKLPAVSLPAVQNPRRPDHFVAPAAHGGQARFVVLTGAAAPWVLAVLEAGQTKPERELEIAGELPAAMHLAGEQLVFGQANEVAFVDVGAEAPARRVLHSRPDMKFKAYDLFVRSGAWLIAIDDVVTPIYADSFGLSPAGPPAHEAGYELPGAINGHYYAGVLAPGAAAGSRDATLYTLVGYGIMSGHGHDLAALTFVAGKPRFDPDALINQAGGKLPVLEEHVDRGTGQPTKLAAGEDFSPWTALGRHVDDSGERLLLCAGARDLMLVPTSFDAGTKAQIIEIEGECLDLLVEGARIWVLSEPDPAEVSPAAEWRAPKASKLLELKLELAGDAPAATVLHSLDLPGHHRFVR